MSEHPMSVSRLPADPGPTGWNAILAPRESRPPLRERVAADWLVIGAGFAGLSAARRLAQLDPTGRVVILEAAALAEGPAGRNSGFMIDLPHDLASDDYGGSLDRDRAQTAANRLAIDFAADAVREYAMPPEAFRRSGKVNGAATDKGDRHNRSYAAHLDALGEAHEWLDADAMRRLTGTGFYRSGLYTPGTAMIQPALYIRSLGEGVVSNRVTLHERSPVTGLARRGGAWVATTPGGSVSAPRVVLAVNGHAESFGLFRRRLMHVHTYASMTRALTDAEALRLGGEREWSLTPADPMGTTVRRIEGTDGARIVVRSRFTYDPSMTVSERRIARVAPGHDRAFAARFPMLEGVGMEFRWGGRLCLSLNGASAFGEVEPGLYSACCQNGLGTVRGTLHGILAAELATGTEPSPILRNAFEGPAPRRLPPEPFAWVGANATMRWKERRAGAEL